VIRVFARWRRVSVAVAGAFGAGVFVAACAATATAPASPSRPPTQGRSTRPDPAPPARLPVGTIGRYRVTQQFLDVTRPSHSGPRALAVWVRRPVIPASAAAGHKLARGLFPLVVFAPGYLQCQADYGTLLNTWASAGYVVAAVQFPRTNCHVHDPDEADLINQPGDVKYVIQRLLALSGAPSGPLSGLIASGQIAVAGHSDGGDTVAAVAANTCCRDRQVKAAVVLAGAEWPPLGGRFFPRASPPVLFVQGSADTWNPPAASQQLYRADTAGPRYYLDLPGAGHFSPYQGGGRPEPLVARVTVDFLDRYLAGQPTGVAMVRAGDVPGEATLVTGGRLPS
jgi:predicted dienelactone hydrolase